MLASIRNAMITNEKASKIYKFFQLLFVGTVFVKIVFVVSIISSHVITESSIILHTFLPFSQLHIAGLQISLSHTRWVFWVLHSHRHLLLIYFWFELHFIPSNLHLHSQDIPSIQSYWTKILITIIACKIHST